ncbi:hypothetical protein AVEN_120306-1 [Araneus ventricosus]|uniref:Endonuclease/exonuclease/phosphatase domain-containing protein n=1 Tax=Araneus ventricosus TaxID=182803 RepID=A0A4Y2RAK9_ARAVE|nr:hypothetical protein AVEN_120306-1 [Araneus ventricosus]
MPKRKAIFASRLGPDIMVNITNFLVSLNLKFLQCHRLKTKYQSDASFHIEVHENDLQQLLDATFWPEGCFMIVENKNLQALIDSQNKTIESLTNRLTVLESNYGFRSSDSPDPGLFQLSDELNNFSPAIPVDTGPGIGFQTGHAPSLLDLSICSADIYNNISLEISHDTYDSDHCPIRIPLKTLGFERLKLDSI